MAWRARVLYEDAATSTEFPLHRLVCALVDDRCGVPGRAAREIEGLPRNGVSKLLGSCGDDRLFAGGAVIFALIDEDKIARELGLSGRPTTTERDRALAERCGRTRPILLIRNLETVIEAVATCGAVDRDLLVRARNKSPVARDRVLMLAAHKRNVRTCVLAAVPSLGQLIDALCSVICPETVVAP